MILVPPTLGKIILRRTEMFDDFEFDLDGIDLSVYTCPVNLEEQYAYTVLLSEGRSAEIKLEWSSLVGMYEVSFDTGYNMNTTTSVFSVRDIRYIFSQVADICRKFHKERGINEFYCVPTCPKRARVYSKALKQLGLEAVGEGSITFKF